MNSFYKYLFGLIFITCVGNANFFEAPYQAINGNFIDFIENSCSGDRAVVFVGTPTCGFCPGAAEELDEIVDFDNASTYKLLFEVGKFMPIVTGVPAVVLVNCQKGEIVYRVRGGRNANSYKIILENFDFPVAIPWSWRIFSN